MQRFFLPWERRVQKSVQMLCGRIRFFIWRNRFLRRTHRISQKVQYLRHWGETADQTVTDPDLGKSVQTNVVWLYGSSEWILPSSAVLPEDDGKGCLIGENTAWKLFGSTNVTGLQICVDDQTRTIRGVVQQPEKRCVSTGDRQKKKVFRRLTLAGDKMEEAQNFLLRYSLTGHVLRMDYLRNWQTLSELVPGRWSDFSGWKENVQTRKQQLRQIAKNAQNRN